MIGLAFSLPKRHLSSPLGSREKYYGGFSPFRGDTHPFQGSPNREEGQSGSGGKY